LKEKRTQKKIVVEAPLVFEIGWQRYFDQIWYVDLQDKTHEEQLEYRTQEKKWPKRFRELLTKRLISPVEKKKRCCNYIQSYSDFENALKEVEKNE
jgi:dephospho-CoA kinase